MSRAQLTSTVEQNTGGAVAPFLAGKNKIINGDFGIWARGTSFSSISSGTFTSDRWFVNFDGSGATRSVSQQTFTPGSAPVAGYESSYFLRLATTVAGSGQTYSNLAQRIENVQTFANQTVVVSFWAKANAAISLGTVFGQNFGSGGSSAAYTVGPSFTLSTSWARYTGYVTLPSISGKTVGTSSYLELDLTWPQNSTFTLDVWGVQAEAGPVATPFTTASGTLQGELALAQRYYFRTYNANQPYMHCFCYNGTSIQFNYRLPVTMRTTPSSMDYSNINIQDISSGTVYSASGAPSLNIANPDNAFVIWTTFSGLTTYRPYNIIGNGTLGYLGFSAEL